jgi:hypothetical protein
LTWQDLKDKPTYVRGASTPPQIFQRPTPFARGIALDVAGTVKANIALAVGSAIQNASTF